MSIKEQIDRINAEKKRIATKTTEFGLTDNDTANIKALADAIEGIQYHDCVDVTITQDGEPFEIVPGYHKGGFIYAVDNPEADKPKYMLEPGRIVTPVKNTDQTIVKGEGYYGLGAVVVKKIPDPYHDVSSVNVLPSEVLYSKRYVDAEGVPQTGEMPDKGAVNIVLDMNTQTDTIQKGYHNGLGSVSINPEKEREVTPSKELQLHTPANGRVLSSVKVLPIPDKYQDISKVTAIGPDVLEGQLFVSGDGILQQGTMPKNQSWKETLSLSKKSVDVPFGFHSGSTVSIDTEDAKIVTPNKGTQSVAPATGKVLSVVTVNPIPDKYQDLTNQNVTAADVLNTAKFVAKDGTLTDGTMVNRGEVSKVLSADTDGFGNHNNYEFQIQQGYHNGEGKVMIVIDDTKEAIPSEKTQSITPSVGTVIGKVTVKPIPTKYKDLTNQTVTAEDVLNTAKFVAKDGTLTDGTIPNLGVIERYVDIYNETGWTLRESGYVRDVSIVFQDQTLIEKLQQI